MLNDKRVLGLVLLNCGVILASAYALMVVTVGLFDEAHPVGKLRGIVYISGLVVVPAALVLLVAGGTVLLSRKSRTPERGQGKNRA